jgi:hypothetical protein
MGRSPSGKQEAVGEVDPHDLPMLADLGAQVKRVATLAAVRRFVSGLLRRLVRMAITAAILAALGALLRAAVGWVSGEPGTPGGRTGSFDTFPPVPPAPVAGNGAS